MAGSIGFLSLRTKNVQTFIFFYDFNSIPQLLQTLGRYAADPELEFSWRDAATLSQQLRKQHPAMKDDSPCRQIPPA